MNIPVKLRPCCCVRELPTQTKVRSPAHRFSPTGADVQGSAGGGEGGRVFGRMCLWNSDCLVNVHRQVGFVGNQVRINLLPVHSGREKGTGKNRAGNQLLRMQLLPCSPQSPDADVSFLRTQPKSASVTSSELTWEHFRPVSAFDDDGSLIYCSF